MRKNCLLWFRTICGLTYTVGSFYGVLWFVETFYPWFIDIIILLVFIVVWVYGFALILDWIDEAKEK